MPVICRTLHKLNLSKHKSIKVPQERFTPYNLVRRRAFVQWRDRKTQQNCFFGDETRSLNDERLFSEHHKKTHIQLKRSRSPSFHLCFRSLLAFSKRYPFQRFLIGLQNNAVSILEATSRVLSGKCVLNSKTIGRRNNLGTHKESVFQGHTKIAL